MVISSWMRLVGDVNLVGNHPAWPENDMYTDAMVIEFEHKARGASIDEVQKYYQFEFEDWQANVAEHGLEAIGKFGLPFSPDSYHKVNVSGSGPYTVQLPEKNADAIVNINGEKMYFVDYLRFCFTWGGFPGFKTKEKGRDNGVVDRLSKQLVAL